MADFNNYTQSGTAAATKEAVAVPCGFKPKRVMVWDENNGTAKAVWMWVDTMAAGSAIKFDASAPITTGGITPKGANDGDTYIGVEVGTGCLTNASKYHIVCER